MPTHRPITAPQVLPEELAALRADLTAADYTAVHVEELLGTVAAEALRRENAVPARRVLAGLTEPAAVLLSVFTLGATVPRAQVDTALPTLGAAGAERLGLIGPAASVADAPLQALVDLAPYAAEDDHGPIRWWIASDRSELATGQPLGPEHVLGVGGASLTLARITPRSPVGRVLDLGCGGGIQALHASRHAEHVVATDLSPRALGFAAFNAALNGIEIECREGSLLEPVRGEQFDLIVSNPPFVITPRSAADAETTWTYRDGRRAGDALLGELLAGLPAHLAPGGSAVMLGNWEIGARQEWDAHPRSWLAGATADGVDAWVLQRETEDPAQYAETWVRDGGVTSRDARWPELVGAWLEDFASRDVERIGFGYVLLRRPASPTAAPATPAAPATVPAAPAPATPALATPAAPGTGQAAPPATSAAAADDRAPARPGVLRTEEAPGTGSGTLWEHLAATLRGLDELAALGDEALLAARPVRAADVVERRHLEPGQWDPMLIELVQGGGFARTVQADQLLAATFGALDGTLTLAQVLGAVCALTDADPDQAAERLLPAVRELLLTQMAHL